MGDVEMLPATRATAGGVCCFSENAFSPGSLLSELIRTGIGDEETYLHAAVELVEARICRLLRQTMSVFSKR